MRGSGRDRSGRRQLENAILKNLLGETLRAYEELLGGEGPPAGQAARPASATPRGRGPSGSGRAYLPTDARTENGVLRRLLVETTRAYEAELDAVAAERSLFQAVLPAIKEAVLVVDASGRVSYLNSAAEALVGGGEVDVKGRPLGAVLRLVEADGSLARLDLEPGLQGGRTLNLRHGLAVETEGRRTAVTGRAAPIRGREGQVLGMALVLSEEGS